MTTRQEIIALADELRVQLDALQARQEFLLLKEDEAKLGGEFAYPSWLTALDELRNEQLLLDAHARMLERMIAISKRPPPRSVSVLLDQIHAPPGVRVY